MKTSIKIILIVLVVAGIGYAFWHFSKGVDDLADKPIATTAFEKHIDQLVQKNIHGQEYVSAQDAFNDIIGEIDTEASITTVDGKGTITSEEKRKCYEIAFYEYAPIFAQYGTSYFNASVWNSSELNALSKEAKRLQDMNIAEAGTDVASQLGSIVQTVDKQAKAWEVVRSAKGCRSVNAVRNVQTQAANYLVEPLTNWTDLKNGLNGAYEEARKALASSVEAQAQTALDKYYTYSTYQQANQALNNAYHRITEYGEAFKLTDAMKNLRVRLEDADKGENDFIANRRQPAAGSSQNRSAGSNGGRHFDDGVPY